METKTIDISLALHKRLKSRAKKYKVTMLKLANEAIKDGLSNMV